jgi:hypothetical protein
VDLTFTDLRQLADVAAGLRDVVSRHGLCRITSELVETVEYRAQLREDVEGAMGSLREFEALLCSEQPLDEPIHLFPAEEGYTDKPSLVSGFAARQSKRRALFLIINEDHCQKRNRCAFDRVLEDLERRSIYLAARECRLSPVPGGSETIHRKCHENVTAV